MIDALFASMGGGLVRASLVAFVVVAFSALLLLAWRRLPPFAVALVWWLVALRVLLELAGVPGVRLPLLAPLQPSAASSSSTPLRHSGLPSTTVRTASPSPELVAAEPLRTPSPLAGLALAWGAGFLLCATIELRRGLRLAAVVRRAAAAAAPEQLAALGDAVATLGLSRPVPLLVSDEIAMPMVVGLFSPRLLLPADPHLGGDELRLVLLHELAHVGRRDALRALVPALARRLLWFHPLVRFAEREFALATEAACDALVLAKSDTEPQRYGRLLVRFAAQRDTGAVTAWAFAARPAGNRAGNQMRRRIQMLVSKPLARRSLFVALPTVALLALAVALPVRLVAASPATPAAPLPPELPQTVAAELPAPAEMAPAAPSTPPSYEVGTRIHRASLPPMAPVAPPAPRAAVAPLPPLPVFTSAIAFAAPPAPPTPALPPSPVSAPAPPAPPAPTAWSGLDADDALVYLDGDTTWVVNANGAERRRAEALAADGAPVVLVRRDGVTRILRDRESIEEVRSWIESSVAPARLGSQELEALARAQEDLSRRLERSQQQIEEAARAVAERATAAAEQAESISREHAGRLSELDRERLATATQSRVKDATRDAERQVEVARREIERKRVAVDREVQRHVTRSQAYSAREIARIEREVAREVGRRDFDDRDLEELLDRLLHERRHERPK